LRECHTTKNKNKGFSRLMHYDNKNQGLPRLSITNKTSDFQYIYFSRFWHP
jgi:hypothetical protein